MASSTCHVVGGTKRVRVERTVRRHVRIVPWRRLARWGQDKSCSAPKRSCELRFVDRRAWELRYRTRSEEHTSELQSLMRISYAVFCLKKKNIKPRHKT